MSKKKIFKFDLVGDFAHFKKPDINKKTADAGSSFFLSYDCIHKPCVVGILGAILGLEGFNGNQKIPEYWKLFETRVAIRPNVEYFHKTMVKMVNSIGYANADGAFIWEEELLLNPNFTIWIECKSELEMILAEMILKKESIFLPYFGNNTYTAYIINETFVEEKEGKEDIISLVSSRLNFGLYYPVNYDRKLFQYILKPFLTPYMSINLLSQFSNPSLLTSTEEGKIEFI